jgi:hypothetical protein
VAVSLFHPSKAVRDATVELFKRFETIQVRPCSPLQLHATSHIRSSSNMGAVSCARAQLGSGFLKNLNFFIYLAFNRQLEQTPA